MITQGEKIKQLRQSLNLSQDEFGAIFNIQKQMVSSLEKNKLKLNNEKLELLCSKYNVNINWLLCGIGDMFIKKEESKKDDDLIEIVKDVLADEIIKRLEEKKQK